MSISSEYIPAGQYLTSLNLDPNLIDTVLAEGKFTRHEAVAKGFLLDAFGASVWQTSHQTSAYRWRGEDTLTWGDLDKWIFAEWTRIVLEGSEVSDSLGQYNTLREIVIKTKILDLETSYQLRSPENVQLFLYEYPKIIEILQDGFFYLRKHFGPDAQFVLDVVTDQESAWTQRQLFVYIKTTYDVEKALRQLECLDNDWFLGQVYQVGDLLNFNIELI